MKYLLDYLDYSWLRSFIIYRRIRGGVWYRHESTGQLPGLYGGWWSRDKDHHPRYIAIIKTENYTK